MSTLTDRLAAGALQNRSLVRAPIWAYRHRLGWMFGPRLTRLEHIGRRSGQPRFVCLEVVERLDANRFVLASGFGPKSQWYRNLRANPQCWVYDGSHGRRPAHARLMSRPESAAVIERYRTEHPQAWKRLAGAITQARGTADVELPAVEITVD